MFAAEREEVLGGTETLADSGVSLVLQGLNVYEFQVRKQTLMIERCRSDQIRVVGKDDKTDCITRSAFDECGGAGLHCLHSRRQLTLALRGLAFAQRFFHALREVENHHDLQSIALDAVQN